MIPFEPIHKNGKVIKLYFDTKADAIKKLNVSRPTMNKICRSGDLFYKYVPQIAKVCKVPVEEILLLHRKL
ncbi:MAG: hypothetical protein Unbinned3205contig1001_22 [Prokaryotic dsDNA virus sp.]|jgi:hypothetical protein|nr:MAG: hypothetical protein Unbinned3205contig1001_22 [Prokaryotic dsDNA virus sp.]